MKISTLTEPFVIELLIVSAGFYLAGYPFSDALAGGFVGGFGIAIGTAIRRRLY